MALNAFLLDPRQTKNTSWRWYDESLLNCCVPLETVRHTGITLPTFACLAKCQGVKVKVHYAQDASLETFREAVKMACVDDEHDAQDDDSDENCNNHLQHVLVVSYDRRTLQQTGEGHFSPIGAYDVASDAVLILDTARFKYGVHWVRVPLLYEAMQSVDHDTGKSRGFVMLSHQRECDDHDATSTGSLESLPVSVLLRSTMEQASIRRHYKKYLLEKKAIDEHSRITWEDVLQYWTDGIDASRVWTLIKLRSKPTPDEGELIDLINSVRALIAKLLPAATPRFESQQCCSCGPHDLRTLDLRAKEVLFIVYLASLPEHERREIVASNSVEASGAAREQLMAEAKLLQIAIETSDEVD
ncbi:hypothetical protein MPSEU_000324600 [Mayamaea pseudoterrestris]|nr:hypothetical protein MPSEU_000324600 [Mayamaea pseudoterrestris]